MRAKKYQAAVDFIMIFQNDIIDNSKFFSVTI